LSDSSGLFEGPDRLPPLIVGGCHRSGTSLFRRLLNGHPNIFCPSEIKFFMDLLCQYPNDPYSHVRLGRTIGGLGLDQETWLKELGQAFLRCYDLAAARHGKRRWADKAPENAINASYWEQLLGDDFFFILIIRHPFDIVASMYEAKMDNVIPLDLKGKAAHVSRYITGGCDYVQAKPGRSMVVKYEDLVRETEATMSGILETVGETYHSAMIDNLFSDAHGSGLEDPKVKCRQRITTANVGRWKSQMDDSQRRALARELGGLCERFGYSLA